MGKRQSLGAAALGAAKDPGSMAGGAALLPPSYPANPTARRMLLSAFLGMAILFLSVVAGIMYSIDAMDRASIASEIERAMAALAVIERESQPFYLAAPRLDAEFGLDNAHFVVAGTEDASEITVPAAPNIVLAWEPRRFGSEAAIALAPWRVAASLVFMAGVSVLMIRLYRLSQAFDLARRHATELASRDPLTGIANRLAFEASIDAALARGTGTALLYLDLDGFKTVNDTQGHRAGDTMLKSVAQRLAAFGSPECVARLGGDEFAILCPQGHSRQELAELASDVIVSLSAPHDLDGRPTLVGASIGIALAEDDEATPDGLLHAADSALYRAKSAGGGSFAFAGAPEPPLLRRAG